MSQCVGCVDAPGDGRGTLVGELATDRHYRRQIAESLYEMVVERDSEAVSERISACRKYRCRGRSSALHHTSGQQQDLTNQWRAFCYKLQHAGFVRGFYARLDGEATTVHAKPKLFLSSGCAPWSSPSTTSSWSRKPFMLMVSQTFSHHRSLRNACLAGFSGLSAAASSNQVHAPKATHSSLLIAKHLKNASRPAAVSILARCSIRRW